MKIFVLKIGGSILYDGNLSFNSHFLEKIIHWFKNQNDYENVVFVVGGGRLSRFLLNQVKERIALESPRHHIGIKVSHVNASMVCSLFNDKDVKYFDSLENLCENLPRGAVIGGLVEGWSTDMVAAKIASRLNVPIVNKISNIDYIYCSDPKVNSNAKPFESLTWDEYIEVFNNHIGQKHEPNMNAPIDIECSVFCKKNNLAFRVTGGNLDVKIDEILKGGTLVS
jgi:uridylate kinase